MGSGKYSLLGIRLGDMESPPPFKVMLGLGGTVQDAIGVPS